MPHRLDFEDAQAHWSRVYLLQNESAAKYVMKLKRVPPAAACSVTALTLAQISQGT